MIPISLEQYEALKTKGYPEIIINGSGIVFCEGEMFNVKEEI